MTQHSASRAREDACKMFGRIALQQTKRRPDRKTPDPDNHVLLEQQQVFASFVKWHTHTLTRGRSWGRRTANL